MSFVDTLLEPGPEHDAVMARLFDHDVTKLIEDDLLAVDRATQAIVHEGVGRLATQYLTDDPQRRLSSETRIRTAMTRDGSLDDLLNVIRQDAAARCPVDDLTTVGATRAIRDFVTRTRRLPDAPFDVTAARDWCAKLDATAFSWETDEPANECWSSPHALRCPIWRRSALSRSS